MPSVAASAHDNLSGSGVTRCSASAIYSAAVPKARPLRWPLNSQTRWPRSNRVTPAPTCSTRPAPSLFGITRSNSIAAYEPARRPTSAGLTPDACRRTSTSPGPATGVGMSPKFSTSEAGPVRSYQTAFMHAVPASHRAGISTAVEQEVLASDKTGLGAAQECAGEPKLLGVADTAGGIVLAALGDQLIDRDALLRSLGYGDWPAQAVGVERARQQAVDGDVVDHGFARDAGDKAGEAA